MAMSPRLLRPRVTGFNPKSIRGLQLWLDAADASSVVRNGTNVSQWTDKSGNARHATQATANNQPAYSLASRNSKNTIVFDGSNDSLLTTSFTVSQPHSLFVVGRRAVGGVNQNFTDGGASGRVAVYWANTDNWSMFAGTALTAPTGQSDTNWHVFAASFSTTSSSLRIDGTVMASGNAGTESYTGLRISGFSSTIALLNGSVAEILAYSGALSSLQISTVNKYLGAKWGITVT